MNRMECGEIADLPLEFAAGRLDEAAAARFQAHLQTCSGCRELVEGRRGVWQALDAWEEPPVSVDFDSRVYSRIEHARTEQDVSWWDRAFPWLRPVWMRRGLPIAAAAGLVVIAGIAVDRSTSVKPAPEKRAIQMESLRPDQADAALQDMEMLQEISGPAAPDSGAAPL